MRRLFGNGVLLSFLGKKISAIKFLLPLWSGYRFCLSGPQNFIHAGFYVIHKQWYNAFFSARSGDTTEHCLGDVHQITITVLASNNSSISAIRLLGAAQILYW